MTNYDLYALLNARLGGGDTTDVGTGIPLNLNATPTPPTTISDDLLAALSGVGNFGAGVAERANKGLLNALGFRTPEGDIHRAQIPIDEGLRMLEGGATAATGGLASSLFPMGAMRAAAEGVRRAGAAMPVAAEAAPIAPELIAGRLRNVGPIPSVQFAPGATPSTAAHQQIRPGGGIQTWIGRTSRFGDDEALPNVGYNPRYDQSIYPGGQTKPPPGNPLLQENFAAQPTTYTAGYQGMGAYPYGPNTLPAAPNYPTPNPRYAMYPRPLASSPQEAMPAEPQAAQPSAATPGNVEQLSPKGGFKVLSDPALLKEIRDTEAGRNPFSEIARQRLDDGMPNTGGIPLIEQISDQALRDRYRQYGMATPAEIAQREQSLQIPTQPTDNVIPFRAPAPAPAAASPLTPQAAAPTAPPATPLADALNMSQEQVDAIAAQMMKQFETGGGPVEMPGAAANSNARTPLIPDPRAANVNAREPRIRLAPDVQPYQAAASPLTPQAAANQNVIPDPGNFVSGNVGGDIRYTTAPPATPQNLAEAEALRAAMPKGVIDLINRHIDNVNRWYSNKLPSE